MSPSEHSTLAIAKSDLAPLQHEDRSTLPCLVIHSGSEPGRRIDLEPGTLTLGRTPAVGSSTGDAGKAVHIAAPGISRRHAELVVTEHSVSLRDLGSANGSRVNQKKVQGSVTLADGDFLQFADVVLKFHRHRTAEVMLHDRIYRLAKVDEGTGVFNRRHLQDVLAREMRRAQDSGVPLSLICYDLDHFKRVNDSHGHPAGDRVLKDTAQAAQQALRNSDVLCRMGGEEFVVVMPGTALREAAAVAEALRAAIAALVLRLRTAAGTVKHQQTVSVGVAQWSAEMHHVGDLLEAADRKLYEAKRSGRDRVCG